MPVNTSAMAAAIDAIVELAQANLGSDTAVVDGPLDDSSDEVVDKEKRLFVGASDATGEDESLTADGEQAFRNQGARNRNETFNVHLVAEGWNGDHVMKTARDQAVSVMKAVESMIRATAANTQAHTLNGAVMYAGIANEAMTQDKNGTGYYCRINFDIACRAYLNQ